MKKIIFKKGDETRSKFENLRDEKILNDSIFSDIYDSAFSLIAEISKQDNSEKSKQYDSEKSEHNRERNNIIAFIGERGSGKTSCLKSVYHSLNKQNGNENSLPAKIKDIKVSFNNQLPIIDPSYLDEQSNIIEIVIAHMFQSFKEAVNNSKYSFEGDNLEKKRELVKKFQEVKDALDCTNPKKYNYASNDSIEELSKLASGSNLHNKMAELVNGYLEYFKSNDDKDQQMLVIAIDDLDVQTNHTYQMVEQIRKYLIIENVVILLGVKLMQLSDLIKKKYVEDFKDKNNGLVLNDQIDDMVARYLIKLLPLSHRLNLPSYNEIPDIELEIVPTDKSENGKNNSYKYINLQENVLSLIYIKTGLTFYNTLEQENMIVPHNLRELLNFIALLSNMEDNDENKDRNRNVFKQYFIESWCLDRLTPKQHIFIKELNECDAVNINKFIIDYLYTEYTSNFNDDIKDIDKFIVDKNNRCYNISIADVNYILDTLSNINNTSIKRFVFAIKTTYSIILYNKFTEINKPENRLYAELFYKYQTRGEISYNSINKLNHISDYEKMLGGNIINIPINDNNKSRYTGVIKAAKMKEYYNSGSIQKFNIFELFLLTTTFYNSHKDARKLKHCYYNSFPVEEYPDNGMVVFNFTSILYNVVRYRILYGKYLYVKEKINSMQDEIQKLNTQIAQNNKEIYNIGTFNTRNELNYYLKLKKDKEKIQSKIDACKKIELYKFFDNIENKKDKSIIYSIIGPDNGRFNLRVSSITNIEILDLLSDYMGRLEKNRTTSPIEDVKSFFKKLSNFRYYRYNKKNNDNDTHCYVEKELNILGINEMISELDINLYNDILNSYKQPLQLIQ